MNLVDLGNLFTYLSHTHCGCRVHNVKIQVSALDCFEHHGQDRGQHGQC